ncbi:MAG: hypothetical protein LC799_36325, partial [Actinobacteria bacterium]|nr:hypothetical protein [Actinomycetota bacterium]
MSLQATAPGRSVRITLLLEAVHGLDHVSDAGGIEKVAKDFRETFFAYFLSLPGQPEYVSGNLGRLKLKSYHQGSDVVRNTVSALAIHLELKSPGVSADIFWLGRQREEVGEEGFVEILGNVLDAD